MLKKIVTAVGGYNFLVRTSDADCEEFGFRHGDKVITAFGQEAVIEGVGPALAGSRIFGKDVMWYTKEDGCTYYFGPGNLRDAGFVLKSD